MDINDDIYTCTAHELELCGRAEGETLSQTLSHMFVCLLDDVCVTAESVSPQMFPSTFDPAVGVKP